MAMEEAKKKIEDEGREETKEKSSRRKFLKKAAYAAPTLVVLGQLGKPESAKADFGGPPSDPGW